MIKDESQTKNNIENVQKPQPHYSLWTEYHNASINRGMKYSAWGATTQPIPNFHLENIKESATNYEITDFQYAKPSGHPELIKSICENFSKIYYKNITPEEIVILPGAIRCGHAIINSFIKLGSNDELLIFDPYYPYYFMENSLFHNVPNFVPIPFKFNDTNNQTEVDFEALKNSLNENSKLLMLINPNNPTGYVYTKEDYEKITEIIEKFPNLVVAEDAAYFPYVIGDNKVVYFSSIKNNYERTITFFSGGKIFNVTGLRVGWIICHPKYKKRIDFTSFCQGNITPNFEQLIIAKDLKSSLSPYGRFPNFWEFVAYDSNHCFEQFQSIMSNYKLKLVRPMGTYYCMADVRPYEGLIPDKFYYSFEDSSVRTPEIDKAFCRMMMSKGIGFMPLSATQSSPKKLNHFIRISINRNENDFKYLKESFESLQQEYGFL